MIAPSPGRGERGAGRVKVDSQTPISPIGYTRFDLLIEVRDGDTACDALSRRPPLSP